ncbi:MAG: adenylate/guanylate cyclase domain-containing protein [Actinomycetes bacterium]
MATCPECGFILQDEFKFCPECATPLTTQPHGVAEERKVVTALFCDLVGFTALSESADPEDVNRMLTDYYVVARAAIEAFGGVVQKFIGDAVVGVFGVPAAHEDDPERAVRAGLRITDHAERLTAVGGDPLLLRVGINTGEALVRLDVTPESGEGFLTGDAINTASRIQSVAPVGGVAVGQTTFDATSAVFEYDPLEPAKVKGKSTPVAVFHAKEPLARLGTDLTRTHDSLFVGREIDLALMKGIFDKTVAAASPQLVTVVGEPGLGKSRIVAELFDYLDERASLVTWRQGRCLPYGEGITFWPLGEIVKAHAGILETDPPDVAISKLDVVLPEGDERVWFRQRLLPLLGIEATSKAERQELFTAWRRFLEHIAEQDPTVIVFEDLHWADEAMLAFIEHLADRAEAVPLLLVGTARPELFERYPEYANGLRNTSTINLAPLSEAETARMVSGLLDATVIPVELQGPILDRGGGNPLYVEEFVRLLQDRDLIVPKDLSWELRPGAEVPFPDSVQALIAARVDTLGPQAKSLLADAAVVGKVFWAGAVGAMSGRDPDAVREVLRELTRKKLVRPARQSSMAGETEYSFWHVLTRDVAYGQLPRASRASRHLAAAHWIETKAGTRLEDLADVLAYHYATAHSLAVAAGDNDLAAELADPALRFLTLAGDRAVSLDTAAAVVAYEQALTLTPPGHPNRANTLTRFGRAALEAARYGDAASALDEAIRRFREAGDLRAAAEAMSRLRPVLQRMGDPRGWTIGAQVVTLLQSLPPGPDLVHELALLSSDENQQGQLDAAIDTADQALALADELGIDPPANAFGLRGAARASQGDREGLADLQHAIDLSGAAGKAHNVAVFHNNLGLVRWQFDGPGRALDTLRAGIAYANPRGLTDVTDLLKGSLLSVMFDTGTHHEALDLASELAAHFEATGNTIDLSEVRAAQTRIYTWRGQAHHAAAWLNSLETTTRNTGYPQAIVFAFAAAMAAHTALGHPDAAAVLLAEVNTTSGTRENPYYPAWLPGMVRTALAIGRVELAEQLLTGVEPHHPYTQHALAAANAAIAEHRGDHQAAATSYADAAQRWEHFGVIPEHAYALLGQGRCLLALGRGAEATPALRQARTIFEQLQAAPALTETDTLIDQATALSS